MDKSPKIVALRFLKIRPRSIGEIKEKLALKGFSSTDIEATVQELMASRLLDDRAFTKAFINYRLARPFGFERIIQELKDKGVDKEIISQAMDEIKASYSSENTAFELAQRRWQRLPEIDPDKKKKRLLDFLLRRGFEANIAMKTVSVIARKKRSD